MNSTIWAPTLVLPIDPNRDHLAGRVDAPVALLEYGDYECPYCAAAHPIVKELQRRLGDVMSFAFRHFPITTLHPHAELAAEAAEGAGARGKFWQMHDQLFAHQDRLSPSDLKLHAQAVGIEPNELIADLEQHLYQARVREDFMSGVRSGVNGTPCFFINGLRHDGGWDVENLTQALLRRAVAS